MNRKEALQKLINGEKIDNEDWITKDEFITMDRFGNMVTNKGSEILSLGYPYGWRIYQEPKEPEKIELPDDNPNTENWGDREIAVRALFNTREIIKYLKQKEKE